MRRGAHEALGARIQVGARPAAGARGHRGHVDDGAAALLAHLRHGFAAEGQHRARVDVHHLVEQRIVELGDGHALDQAAGVVHQHVDAAELRRGFLHAGADRGGVAHVGLQREGRAAGGADGVDHAGRRIGRAVVVHGHAHAARGERDGHRGADARAGAGDEGGLVLEVFHGCAP
ncbi:hypothetical protein D3C72_1444220 [compost metagenome]